MPARKGSKKLVLKHSYLGKFQTNKKNIKDMEEKIQEQQNSMHRLNKTISENKRKINELESKLKDQNKLVSHKTKQIEDLTNEIESAKSKTEFFESVRLEKYSIALTSSKVNFIHDSMNCNFLSKKIQRWYNDSTGKVEKDFTFRFRGKESLAFLRNFPGLILLILNNIEKNDLKQRLHEIHYQCIYLRKLLSLTVRITDFNKDLLDEMFTVGSTLLKVSCLFDQNISPSLWTLCNAGPEHAKLCHSAYSFGLGCNTMEGREQKHQAISKYASNTTYQNRWPLIFRHEYIHLIYLRENGFDQINCNNKKHIPYIPEVDEINNCKHCCLPLQMGHCELCSSVFMQNVEKIVLEM